MKKLISILICLMLCLATIGCIESSGPNMVEYKPIDDPVITAFTSRGYWGGGIIIGKVIGIDFRTNAADTLLFEDGFIYTATRAEAFQWKLGSNHSITVGRYKITEVKILD